MRSPSTSAAAAAARARAARAESGARRRAAPAARPPRAAPQRRRRQGETSPAEVDWVPAGTWASGGASAKETSSSFVVPVDARDVREVAPSECRRARRGRALFARSRALTLGFSAKYEVSSASSGLGTKAGTKAGSSASCSRSHALWIPSQSTPAKNGCALTSAAPSRVPRRSSTSGRRSARMKSRAAPDKPASSGVGIRAGVGVGGGVGVGARVRGFLQSGLGRPRDVVGEDVLEDLHR